MFMTSEMLSESLKMETNELKECLLAINSWENRKWNSKQIRKPKGSVGRPAKSKHSNFYKYRKLYLRYVELRDKFSEILSNVNYLIVCDGKVLDKNEYSCLFDSEKYQHVGTTFYGVYSNGKCFNLLPDVLDGLQSETLVLSDSRESFGKKNGFYYVPTALKVFKWLVENVVRNNKWISDDIRDYKLTTADKKRLIAKIDKKVNQYKDKMELWRKKSSKWRNGE